MRPIFTHCASSVLFLSQTNPKSAESAQDNRIHSQDRARPTGEGDRQRVQETCRDRLGLLFGVGLVSGHGRHASILILVTDLPGLEAVPFPTPFMRTVVRLDARGRS